MRSRRQPAAAALTLVAVTVLAASGCSRAPETTATTAADSTPVATAHSTDTSTGTGSDADFGTDAVFDTCEVAKSGADVRVQLSGVTVGDTLCVDMARDFSGSGSFWTANPPVIDTSRHRLVCVMTDGDHAASVLDTGGAMYGEAVCASMFKAGWQEDARAEDAHAQAQASAAAAATQAQAAQRARADEEAQLALDSDTALTALAAVRARPAALTESLGQVDDALARVTTALAQQRKDAAEGRGENCDNVRTVSYDAEQDVAYEVTQGVGYAAEQHVGADIDAARSDLDTLEQAVATLSAHPGAQLPPGIDAARAKLRSAVTAAITHTNSAIDTANRHGATAYAIARKLATGACSSDGPGTFKPVPHLR